MGHAARSDIGVIRSQHAAGMNIKHYGRATLTGHRLSDCPLQFRIVRLRGRNGNAGEAQQYGSDTPASQTCGAPWVIVTA